MADPNNYAGAQAGYADKAVSASPFDRLVDTVSQLREIQKMARHIADKLTGSAPQEGQSSKLAEIGGGGLIDGMERQASFIREIHADVYASLSRIENRL